MILHHGAEPWAANERRGAMTPTAAMPPTLTPGGCRSHRCPPTRFSSTGTNTPGDTALDRRVPCGAASENLNSQRTDGGRVGSQALREHRDAYSEFPSFARRAWSRGGGSAAASTVGHAGMTRAPVTVALEAVIDLEDGRVGRGCQAGGGAGVRAAAARPPGQRLGSDAGGVRLPVARIPARGASRGIRGVGWPAWRG